MPPTTKPATIATGEAPADLLTLVSVGIVAYVLATVLHEGLGHGGACVLVGGKPLVVSTVQQVHVVGAVR